MVFKDEQIIWKVRAGVKLPFAPEDPKGINEKNQAQPLKTETTQTANQIANNSSVVANQNQAIVNTKEDANTQPATTTQTVAASVASQNVNLNSVQTLDQNTIQNQNENVMQEVSESSEKSLSSAAIQTIAAQSFPKTTTLESTTTVKTTASSAVQTPIAKPQVAISTNDTLTFDDLNSLPIEELNKRLLLQKINLNQNAFDGNTAQNQATVVPSANPQQEPLNTQTVLQDNKVSPITESISNHSQDSSLPKAQDVTSTNLGSNGEPEALLQTISIETAEPVVSSTYDPVAGTADVSSENTQSSNSLAYGEVAPEFVSHLKNSEAQAKVEQSINPIAQQHMFNAATPAAVVDGVAVANNASVQEESLISPIANWHLRKQRAEVFIDLNSSVDFVEGLVNFLKSKKVDVKPFDEKVHYLPSDLLLVDQTRLVPQGTVYCLNLGKRYIWDNLKLELGDKLK